MTPPKNDNFSYFAKHRFIKKPFCCNPSFWPNIVFSTWVFWNQKQWCWTKNITQNQEKTKIRKLIFKEKTRQETQRKRNYWWKRRNWYSIFSCCSFHETKAKKKEKWKKRQKQETKRKQTRKTRRKKERQEQERETEKEKQKKGEAKKG